MRPGLGLETVPERVAALVREVLPSNFPPWLAEEIRADSLSICEWGSTDGELVDALRSHFQRSRVRGVRGSDDLLQPALPADFDVVICSGLHHHSSGLSRALARAGACTTRHLLVSGPLWENSPGEPSGGIDDSDVPTRVAPDFLLSHCTVIPGADSRQSAGSRILLVYSRTSFFPHGRGLFEARLGAPKYGDRTPAPPRIDSLYEAGRTAALLEARDAELRASAAREAGLKEEIAHLRRQMAGVNRQLDLKVAAIAELQAVLNRARQEAGQVSAKEKVWAAENQQLKSRLEASGIEAAGLRSQVRDLENSLSWKVTAPLRVAANPLFRVLAPKPSPVPPADPPPAPDSGEGVAPAAMIDAERIEALVLPAVRRARSIAVVSCALPYSTTLNHRPISCARYLADHGYTVIFVEIWGTAEEPRHVPGEEVYPGILAIPLEVFEQNLEVIANASPNQRSYLCTIPHAGLWGLVLPLRAQGFHIHYDIMDDWQEFHRVDQAEWYSFLVEKDLIMGSDSVTAVSSALVQKFAACRSDIAVVGNGYQPSAMACEQFIAAHTPLEHPKTIGYFGHFSDGWFDWDTVFHAARERPQYRFELIGWGLSESARARMSGFPNVTFVGLVPQSNLHSYAKKWWAAMIPFVPSPLSAAVDPLKIYEYLHLGLNSLVTGISGIASYPMVWYAADQDGFVAALDQLPDRPDGQTLAAAAEFLKMCLWDRRLESLKSMMEEQHGLYGSAAH